MLRARRRVSLAVAGALILVAAACGGDDGGGGSGARPESTATLEIVEPEPGATVTGDTVHVELRLEGGEIVDQVSRDLTPDEGHVHLTVDGELVTQTFALSDDIAVEPGDHVMQAEFVAKDHAPFDPRVVVSTSFTVEGEG